MTFPYLRGKPATSRCLTDHGLGWRHTVIDENNFVSPWEASSRALDLAFELDSLAALGSRHNTFTPRCRRTILGRQVSFKDAVEIYVGFEDSLAACSTIVEQVEISTAHAKPWGWFYLPDVWSYDSVEDRYTPHKVNRHALDPLSPAAVLIRHFPPIGTLKTTDTWHNPLPPEALRAAVDEEEADPDIIPDPAVVPLFIQDLFDIAGHHGIFDDPDGDGILRVRSWFLHHHDDRLCQHPRILEFEDDWRTWERDLGIAWRSHIRPNQEIQIHVARPDPYKGYMTRPAHADVVISQGHWLPRYSSVVTVHKVSRYHEPVSYALACSFERWVSGVQIASDADVLQWCNFGSIRCQISFGWMRIPFTMRRTHEVQHGHAFVIQIGDANPSLASTGTPRNDPQDELQTAERHDTMDFDMHDEGHDGHPQSPLEEGEMRSESSLHSSDLSLLIYRLGGPDAHGFTEGTTYTAMLNAAIRACRLPRSLVRCFHHLAVTPIGVADPHETAIILQTVDDIDAGSNEKLVLVDVEVHYHPLGNGLVVPSANSRKVLRVNPHLHREQLLLLLGLHEYCSVESDRCIILLNYRIWSLHDRRVLDIQHGTYFRVQVPPPLDSSMDTEMAIGIARDLAEDAPVLTAARPSCSHSLALRQTMANLQSCSLTSTSTTTPDTSPQGRFAPGAQRRLEWILREANLVECEEEGQIMYIQTWLLHHRLRPRCHEGKPIRLTQDSTNWLDEIVAPWIDELDHTLPFIIRVVNPTPPCHPLLECVQAHLIIEQDERPRYVSALISFIIDIYADEGWQHLAFTLENFQNVRGVLLAAGLWDMCQHNRHSLHTRGLPFAWVDFEEIGNAWGFVLRIHNTPMREASDDEQSLLQKDVVQHGNDLPPALPECHIFNPPALFGQDASSSTIAPNNILAQPTDIINLHDVWRSNAFSWESEEAVAHFMVWYLCPGGGIRRCLHGRRVSLPANFLTWRERLVFAWRDQVLGTFHTEIHVVQPHPRPLEEGIAAHVILTQLMIDQEAGILVNIHDNAINEGYPFRIATTVRDPCQLTDILAAIHYEQEQAQFGLQFFADTIAPNQFFQVRTGMGLDFFATRTFLSNNWTPPIFPAMPGTEGLGLLQTHLAIAKNHNRERLTHGTVAQDHGPRFCDTDVSNEVEEPLVISLSLAETLSKIVALVPGTNDLIIPDFIELPIAAEEAEIEAELSRHGQHCHAFLFGQHDKAFCVPWTWLSLQTSFHVLFANADVGDAQGTFVHTFAKPWKEIQSMSLLHRLGYEKAFILHITIKSEHLALVIFGESHGMLAPLQKVRLQKPWPMRQPATIRQPLITLDPVSDANCLLRLGLNKDDLDSFNVYQDILCKTFDGLDLPTATVSALVHTCSPLEIAQYDRIVIYVDGTSQPNQKHLPILQVDLEGIPDAWAFLVLGETYLPDGGSCLSVLGWQTQQVRYDSDCPNFAGALKVGSHIAEREGMFFAALWRAHLNLNTPTIFRSDSSLTCKQATGEIGALEVDFSFTLLRGIFQFLEVTLGPDALGIEHIYGHNHDPWNEAVDWLAKAEARKSHFLPRLQVDLRVWGKAIPFLWMLAGQRFGCPKFCGNGFDVHPPDMPSSHTPDSGQREQTPLSCHVEASFCVSMASGNVSTLGIGTQGHAGKLDYIRDQFCALRLNFLGAQETRTSSGQVFKDTLLRLCSGADGKNLGVEFWCNLSLPFAYVNGQPQFLQPSHFQVLHRDPRRLILIVQHEIWTAQFFVGHAPHSGFALQTRRQWWNETSRILHECGADHDLFVLLDANAPPGDCDHRAVLGPGFHCGSGTPLLRQFLDDHALCLPSTSALHVGVPYTWTAPDGQGHHLIDYIAIPCHSLANCTWSQTLEQFDLNPSHDDHLAVGIELRWSCQFFFTQEMDEPNNT